MSRNLQREIHPDADQLSVFVEGAASAREQEKMLAHLAECTECRKAVFLMQPHEEPQIVAATPEKGRMWRWLVPVGLPAAALACGLIALLVYIRPDGARQTPQQMASVRQVETERPGTTLAPANNLEQGAQAANTGREARSRGRENGFDAKGAATNLSRQEKQIESGSNLPAPKSGQAAAGAAGAAPQTTVTAPSAPVPVVEGARVSGGISSVASDSPVQSRNVMDLQQLPSPKGIKDAAPQNTLADKKELGALQIQRGNNQNTTLAEVSGHITDPSGAVVAGATVTLRDAESKTRQTTTDADGSFHLIELPAGQYELTATARGFKTSRQSVELKPRELAMLQPVLDVAAASEVVTVEAGTQAVQTESASLSGRQMVVAELPSGRRVIAVPSSLPVAGIVSHGKRVLSLDDAGNLFLSRNEGKKWKKIKPQWAGKAVRVELTSVSAGEAAKKRKDQASGAADEPAVFLLTTDGGTLWKSRDGTHWRQQ